MTFLSKFTERFKRIARAADVRPDPMIDVDAALREQGIKAANQRLNESLPPVTHPFPDGGMYGKLD